MFIAISLLGLLAMMFVAFQSDKLLTPMRNHVVLGVFVMEGNLPNAIALATIALLWGVSGYLLLRGNVFGWWLSVVLFVESGPRFVWFLIEDGWTGSLIVEVVLSLILLGWLVFRIKLFQPFGSLVNTKKRDQAKEPLS